MRIFLINMYILSVFFLPLGNLGFCTEIHYIESNVKALKRVIDTLVYNPHEESPERFSFKPKIEDFAPNTLSRACLLGNADEACRLLRKEEGIIGIEQAFLSKAAEATRQLLREQTISEIDETLSSSDLGGSLLPDDPRYVINLIDGAIENAGLESDEQAISAIKKAYVSGDKAEAIRIIIGDDDFTTKDPYGMTLLAYAAYHPTLSDLLDVIWSSNFQTIREINEEITIGGLCLGTALHFACASENFHAVKKLIDYNASVNAENYQKVRPLHLALNAIRGFDTDDMIRDILSFSTARTPPTASGRSIMDYAVFCAPNTIINLIAARVPITQLLISLYEKSLFSCKTEYVGWGITKGMYEDDDADADAEESTDIPRKRKRANETLDVVDLINLAIDACDNIHYVEDDGRNSLYLAAEHNCSISIIDKLIRQGIDVNFKGPNGRTALHVACSKNHVDLAHFLVSRGANLYQSAQDNYRALDLCPNEEFYKSLIEEFYNISRRKALESHQAFQSQKKPHITIETLD